MSEEAFSKFETVSKTRKHFEYLPASNGNVEFSPKKGSEYGPACFFFNLNVNILFGHMYKVRVQMSYKLGIT